MTRSQEDQAGGSRDGQAAAKCLVQQLVEKAAHPRSQPGYHQAVPWGFESSTQTIQVFVIYDPLCGLFPLRCFSPGGS